VAICDYDGEEGDLKIGWGDVIEVLRTSNDGWWTGKVVRKDGGSEEGTFPANLVVGRDGGRMPPGFVPYGRGIVS
jgi:hypothetical protein